jgi:hypothetical protein
VERTVAYALQRLPVSSVPAIGHSGLEFRLRRLRTRDPESLALLWYDAPAAQRVRTVSLTRVAAPVSPIGSTALRKMSVAWHVSLRLFQAGWWR